MRPLQSWRLPKGSASPISAAFCAHPARRGPRRACSERGGRRLGSRGSCSRDSSTAAIDRDIHAASQLPRSRAEVDQQWGQLYVRLVWTASAMCCIFSCMGRPTTNVYEVPAPDAEVLGLVRARRLQDRRCGAGQRAVQGALHRAGSAGALRRAAPACLRRAGGLSGACGYRGNSEPC